jgi:broad specificity phosphatase PhoE
MNTLVFIRHGETDMAGTYCGQSDPELNSAGELQIARAAEEVAQLGIERVYASDLRRASRTASIIAGRIGRGVELLPDLREMYFGLWEGLRWKEIETRFPQDAELWIKEYPLQSAPQGEAYAAFTSRVDKSIEFLLSAPPAQKIAVVTHRGVMCYALTKFFGFSETEAWTKTAPYGAVVVASNAQGKEDL